MTDYDPRSPEHRVPQQSLLRAAVKDLVNIFPDACIGHLWGIDHPPPDAINNIEVETTVTLDELIQQMIIHPGMIQTIIHARTLNVSTKLLKA